MLRSIQTYHMDVQGWNDIAYNFAVDRFGRTWEARAGGVTQTVIGGHAKGFTTYTTGVMGVGDITCTTPSQATAEAGDDEVGNGSGRAGGGQYVTEMVVGGKKKK